MDRALIFDCDGVLGDTELYGHLPAFNQMWQKMGVPWQWSERQYGEKLKIGGGKERMASLFADADFRALVTVPEDAEERKALVARWHKEKTAIYESIINSGKIPARPGIKRLSQEALKRRMEAGGGFHLGAGRGGSRAAARRGEELEREFLVLSGDIVLAKKPAPDIYNLAVERLRLTAADCIAIEDSRNGMLAAYAAHIPVLVTISAYTKEENFREAAVVVDSLGDAGGPATTVLESHVPNRIAEYVKIEDLPGSWRPRQPPISNVVSAV